MNAMLTDEELTRLLAQAAQEFEVPAHEALVEVAAEVADAKPLLRKRSVRVGAAAAALLVGVLVVQSVTGGGPAARTDVAGTALRSEGQAGGATGSGGTSGGATALSDKTALVPVPEQAPAVTSRTSSTYSAAVGAPEQAPPAAAPQPAAAPDAQQDGARIVKTGTIGLVVRDGQVGAVAAHVRGLATTAGGYVSDERSQEYGDDPTSTITMRVPVAAFERTVQAVRNQVAHGVGKVESASASGQDVTAQYADLQAQIASLTAARNRFLVILSKATTIGETLSVQQRVDSTQLQIDRLEGQRRTLAKQSDLATLTVTVSETPRAVKAAHARSGLAKAWDDAVHGFTSGFESLVAHSGRALLVLIVAALALVVLRQGWRLARRRLV